jgi:hypothetical protein
MLTHVALDAETLVAGGWPHPSVDLEDLVASCRALSIPLLLSSVVLIETETIWLERTGDRVAKARGMVNDLRRNFEALVAQEVTLPNRDALRTAYRTAVEAIGNRWKWHVIVPPSMSAQEIVELSARHEPPFRGKGDSGFRDSYNAMAVVTSAGRGSEIGLVTADNGLGDSAALATFAKSNGVTIRRFRSAREAFEVIEREGKSASLQALMDEIAERSARLANAVTADHERMAAFVRAHLEIPTDVGGPLAGTLEAIRAIEVGEALEAHAGLPGDDRTGASVTVAVAMEVELTKYVWSRPLGLKEGQRDESAIDLSRPRVTVTSIAGQATVDLRVVWPDEEKALPQVEYVDVEYGDAKGASVRKFTRLLLERS